MPASKTAVRQTRQESRERIVAAATELVRSTSYGALTVDDYSLLDRGSKLEGAQR